MTIPDITIEVKPDTKGEYTLSFEDFRLRVSIHSDDPHAALTLAAHAIQQEEDADGPGG